MASRAQPRSAASRGAEGPSQGNAELSKPWGQKRAPPPAGSVVTGGVENPHVPPLGLRRGVGALWGRPLADVASVSWGGREQGLELI